MNLDVGGGGVAEKQAPSTLNYSVPLKVFFVLLILILMVGSKPIMQ